MPTLSKNWTQRQKDRFEASGAVDYVIGIADGTVEPDPLRMQNCWRMIDKLVPTLKAMELAGQIDTDVTLKWEK